MALLEVTDVVKRYRIPGQAPIPVLGGVSFAVEAGEHVAIVGRSGAGKTTLLNILGGLDRPTAGDVVLGGVSLFKGLGAARRRSRLRATEIGFIFQSYHLMPELDIVENVLLPSMTGYARMPKARDRAKELLAKVGLADRLGHLPAELSGGEQQRVALARAHVPAEDHLGGRTHGQSRPAHRRGDHEAALRGERRSARGGDGDAFGRGRRPVPSHAYARKGAACVRRQT